MKKLLILLCLPMIGFGQDEKIIKSKFNFNKSNNYGSITKGSNSAESYTNSKVQDSKDSIQRQNNQSNIFFNKGLIGILSETMKKKSNNNPFTLKKQKGAGNKIKKRIKQLDRLLKRGEITKQEYNKAIKDLKTLKQ